MITDESFPEIGEHAVLKASCGLNIFHHSPTQLWKCWDRVPPCAIFGIWWSSQNGDYTYLIIFIHCVANSLKDSVDWPPLGRIQSFRRNESRLIARVIWANVRALKGWRPLPSALGPNPRRCRQAGHWPTDPCIKSTNIWLQSIWCGYI